MFIKNAVMELEKNLNDLIKLINILTKYSLIII